MERERLTITLRKDLLTEVDRTIDGQRIRNRSHAIEFLLAHSLTPQVSRAIVLAGGAGVKMRPLTLELPKAMIPVRGRPILEHTLDTLRRADIRNVTVLVGALGDKIRNHFGDGSAFGMKIEYVQEGKRSGTAGGLRKAASKSSGEPSFRRASPDGGPLLLIYGDVLADIDLKDMIEYHKDCGAKATLAVTSVDKATDWGIVRLHGTRIVSFEEKPKNHVGQSHLVNAGVAVIEPKLLDAMPNAGFSMLERDVFPKLARAGQLAGYLFEGQWFDIATPEIYEEALKNWQPVKA
ncbi:MAG: sugar phosphate nucleotidyltransferase [Patescibacteria group bacterium]